MQPNTPNTLLTVSSLLLVLITCHTHLHSCVCAQIPTRFFYNNQGAGAVSGSSEGSQLKAAGETNLKLIEELREKDPIPMEFYKELDNVTDVSEFIERFVDKDSIDPQFGIQENLRRSVERAAGVIPKPANCIPENTVVPLPPLNPSTDPKIIYQPKCTRVKRCGGCCGSDLMSCQPIETETINFQINKYQYGEKLALVGREIVVVEQHTKCKCACRIKEEDCKSYQVYQNGQCRCACTNEDARQKCLAEEEHKLWDEKNCRCACRDNQSCTTGTVFDESQCKCVDQSTDVGVTPNLADRRRFIVKAVPVEVETDDSTLYSL